MVSSITVRKNKFFLDIGVATFDGTCDKRCGKQYHGISDKQECYFTNFS